MKKSILVLLALVSFLLGCVSNQDKPNTPNNNIEITRDECIKKARNSDPEHPTKQCSLELTELMNMFLSAGDNGYIVWAVGAEVNTPINWTSIGRACDGRITSDAPERCGEIFITINNKITHTVLEKTIQPGVWRILLFGSRIGVDKVELEIDTDLYFYDIIDYLKNGNIMLKVLVKNNSFSGTGKEELYEIKTADKETAWLKNSISCGVSGAVCSTVLTIFYDRDTAIKSMENVNP